ncbi:DUF6368 family protein [Streptomyces sp. NPDC001450]
MGPVVGLWLFDEGRGAQEVVAGLLPWLETFCDPVRPTGDGHADFRIADARPLGLEQADVESTGCFTLGVDEQIPADDEDYAAFPCPPAHGIVLSAGSSGRPNHRALGRLALTLARRLDATIDFDGMLFEGPSPFPGTLREVSYDTGDGERWVRHVGDAEFLAAWLRHPGFHLVK